MHGLKTIRPSAWCTGTASSHTLWVYVDQYTTTTTPAGQPPTTLCSLGKTLPPADIGEPLGTVARRLRPEVTGIHWWGSLGTSMPWKNVGVPADNHPPSPEQKLSPRTCDDHELSALNITDLFLGEMRAVNDWVSIADALKVMETTSFVAGRDDVQRVLDCADSSDRLRLGRVSYRFDEIPKTIPVAALLDRIFSKDGPSDRSAAMMELFIAGDIGLPIPRVFKIAREKA